LVHSAKLGYAQCLLKVTCESNIGSSVTLLSALTRHRASHSPAIEEFADPQREFFGVHQGFGGVNHGVTPLRSAPALNRKSLFSGYRMAEDDQSVFRLLIKTSLEISLASSDVHLTAHPFKKQASAFEQVCVLAVTED
jgi:hypothetical protein